MENFVHLHVHDHGSLRDALGIPAKYIQRVKELNQKGYAITNHGALSSIYDAYEASYHDNNIKVLYGCELYLVDDYRIKIKADRHTKAKEKRKHVILIAKNEEGWKNLIYLVSLANTDGQHLYYGKYYPRIDFQAIKERSKGLICLSACMGGELAIAINKDIQKADDVICKYKDVFGDDYYLELIPNELKEQQKVNYENVRLSKKYNIKCVATNDTHYINAEDNILQDTLLMIGGNKTIEDKNAWRFDTRELYLKTYEEMLDSFKRFNQDIHSEIIEEALQNTMEVFDKCEKINLKSPKYILPAIDLKNYKYYNEYINNDDFSYTDTIESDEVKEYLKFRCFKELENSKYRGKKEYIDRLDYELKIINNFGYAEYFLLVEDVVNWSRDNGIGVGAGRGSVGGSLVSYILKITRINPITNKLYFERFLNPERQKPPDIDLDFEDIRRNEVKEYMSNKYGKDNMCEIIAYSKYSLNTAVRDILRTRKAPFDLVNTTAKRINEELTLEDNVKKGNINNDFYEQYKEEFKLASKLSGQIRHETQHCASVTLTDKSVYDYFPVKNKKDSRVTQWDGVAISNLNFLKFDVLGLNTLRIINDCLKLIKKRHNKDIAIDSLDMNDKYIYEMFQKGRTIGIFQFASYGMRNVLRRIKPVIFNDLIVVNALYRPALILSNYIDKYIHNRENPKDITYIHEGLENIFGDTCGVCLFQEQMMQLISQYGDLSLGEADIIRRLTESGSVVRSLSIDTYKEKFIKNATKKFGEEVAYKIWKMITDFSVYSFNKSHSAGYAYIAYQQMYLKHYYPLEYMVALLNANIGDKDLPSFIKECKKKKIELLPPDVNKSAHMFSIENNAIRVGFLSIKNIGANSIESILEARPYKNYQDFLDRVNKRRANKRIQEALLKMLAFNEIDNSLELLNKYLDIRKEINIDLVENWYREYLGFDLINSTKLLEKYKWLYSTKVKTIDNVKSNLTSAYIVARVLRVEHISSKGKKYHKVFLEDDSDNLDINFFNNNEAYDLIEGNIVLLYIFKKGEFWNIDRDRIKVLDRQENIIDDTGRSKAKLNSYLEAIKDRRI